MVTIEHLAKITRFAIITPLFLILYGWGSVRSMVLLNAQALSGSNPVSYAKNKKQYYNATLIVRQMLDYAIDQGIIDANPMKDVHPNGKTMFHNARKKVVSLRYTVKTNSLN